MKSQRRHELQHNTLDAELSRIGSFFKRNAIRLSWVVLIIAIVALGWVFLNRHADAQQAEVQGEFDRFKSQATLPGPVSDEVINGLRQLSGQDTNERIAAGSLLELGRIFANMVLNAPDKKQRDDALSQSRKNYEKIVSEYGKYPVLVGTAKLGLGKLAENQGDFKAARKYYQAVMKMSELEGYPVLAQARDADKKLESFNGKKITLATYQPPWMFEKPTVETKVIPKPVEKDDAGKDKKSEKNPKDKKK
ncbi:MAG: hypothetical protein K8S55_06825 [Phycisphaerae bacterium]|nr:hypothetical protein [Phycisphaerae bacterium]